MTRPLLGLALGFLLLACGGVTLVTEENDASQGVSGPLLGADGKDQAERACQVVLRELARRPGSTGGYEVSCPPGGSCWYVWTGLVDLSVAAVRQGLVPEVLYRSSWNPGASWQKVKAVGVPGAPDGYARFQFRLDRDTAPSGASFSALSRTRIEVAPYALSPSGARLFDHNRRPGDFDTYVLEASNGWSVAADAGVCPPRVGNRATLEFLPGWTQAQHGALVASGTLRVEYDLGRLTSCRGTHNGFPTWDVRAFVRFLPSGQVVDGTVREYDQRQGTPLPTGHAVPFEAKVPPGSTAAELWFLNANGAGDGCVAYDSNLGQNYRFEVLAAPPAPVGWAGDFGGSFSRACVHADGLAEPVWLNGYIRERACSFVDADVWVPGLTDQPVLHPEQLAARVEFSVDAKPVETAWLTFVARVGNNYRYRWELPRARMGQEFWNTYRYHLAFSTDGHSYHRVGQGAGPEGGPARTLERDPTWCNPGWNCAR